MRKVNLRTIVWKEGKHYIFQCLNIDVSSFGSAKQEAPDNLQEALELYFEDADTNQLPRVERPDIVPLTLQYA
jgi:predicted RNase H-like HicB family nuclease